MFWLWKINAVAADVALNGAVTGRTFARLGAVGAGASLQHLQLEIGGEFNFTDGTDPTHMRTVTDLNLNLGYEWWLLQQAKARNPGLIWFSLAGLKTKFPSRGLVFVRAKGIECRTLEWTPRPTPFPIRSIHWKLSR